MTKRYKRNTDGEIEKTSYGDGYAFRARQVDADGVDSILNTLRRIEPHKRSCIIRGKPLFTPDDTYRRRLLSAKKDSPATYRDSDRQWVCIDVDSLNTPSTIDPLAHPEQLAAFARDQLPAPFHGAACAVQWSSSMGITGLDKCKVHLWFWLDRKVCNASLKDWFRANDPRELADRALFNAVQIHYTAAPDLANDVHDPLAGRRLFRLDGAPCVCLPPEVHDLAERERLAEEKRKRDELARERRRRTRPLTQGTGGENDRENALLALERINPSLIRNDWYRVFLALWDAFDDRDIAFEHWDRWSQGGSNYKGRADLESVASTLSRKNIHTKTLYHIADWYPTPTQAQLADEHERIAHTVNTARPTQTFDTIKKARDDQRGAMVADLKNGGVYVYASPCGLGKSTTIAPLIVEHVKALADHAIATKSKTPRTIFAARSRAEAEATVQRLRHHASKHGELIKVVNYHGRNAETCHEFDRYIKASSVIPMGGRHICTPEHGCQYREGQKAMLAGVDKAHITVTTHHMIPHLLEDCKESGAVVDTIVYDEGFDQQEHVVSVSELRDFANQDDIDGAGRLIDLIERSKPTDNNPHHTIDGAELVAALEAITINSDSAESIAGAVALEELLIDGAARDTAALPQWQTLDALALAKEAGGVGARAHNGELYLPLKPCPDYLKARAVFILDASATELSSRLIYGGERIWRRFAPKPNEHVYHFHIRMPFSKRAVTVNGECIEYSSKTVELCLEVARWLAAVWPGDTLFAGRKDWYNEDGNTPLWDGPSTWIGSALAKGSNDFEDCTSCICADYRAAGHTLDAYANTLRALAVAQGLEVEGEVFALEAQIKHELTHLEQVAGRIRAIMASEDNPQMIITMGSGPAPYLEYAEHTATLNSDDVLLNFYGIVKPSTQHQFLKNLTERIGGLPLSVSTPPEWLKSALYAEGTPLSDSSLYILGLFGRGCPFTEKYKSYDFKESVAYKNHGAQPHDQVLKISNENTHRFNPTYITNSQGNALPWMLPKDTDPLPRLQDYANARGWSWFELHGDRHVLSDGQWINNAEYERERVRSTLEYLGDVGIKETSATGEIYGALEDFWQCGERGRKKGLRELFGGLNALRSQLPSTANHAEQQMRPEHTAPTPASASGWAAPSPNPHEPARRGDAEAAVYRAAPTPTPECIDEPDAEMTVYALTLREYRSQFGAILAHLISHGATRSTPDGRLISLISDCHDCPGEWFETMEDDLRDALPGTPPAQPKPDYSDFEILF